MVVNSRSSLTIDATLDKPPSDQERGFLFRSGTSEGPSEERYEGFRSEFLRKCVS